VAAIDVPLTASAGGHENEAKEDPNDSDVDGWVEHGRTRGVAPGAVSNPHELAAVGLRAGNPLFEVEEKKDGEQGGMAVRAWLGALKPPSVLPDISSKAPAERLVIEWVYGYRGYDSRANVFYNSQGTTCAVLCCGVCVLPVCHVGICSSPPFVRRC
jgi:hypothetical protein